MRNKGELLFNFPILLMFFFFLQLQCIHVMVHSYFTLISATAHLQYSLLLDLFFQCHFHSIFTHIHQSSWPKVNTLNLKFTFVSSYKSRFAAAAAKSLQSCPTLCDPIDGSPPGPAVPGILQARTLKWVAVSSFNAWKWKVKVKSLSRLTPSDPMDCSPPGSSIHGIFQARVLEWGAIASREFHIAGFLSFKRQIKYHCLRQVFSDYSNEVVISHSNYLCNIYSYVTHTCSFIHLLFIVYLLPTNDMLHEGRGHVYPIFYLRMAWGFIGVQWVLKIKWISK